MGKLRFVIAYSFRQYTSFFLMLLVLTMAMPCLADLGKTGTGSESATSKDVQFLATLQKFNEAIARLDSKQVVIENDYLKYASEEDRIHRGELLLNYFVAKQLGDRHNIVFALQALTELDGRVSEGASANTQLQTTRRAGKNINLLASNLGGPRGRQPETRAETRALLTWAAGLYEPDLILDPEAVQYIKMALTKTVSNGWFTDLSDVILVLQGHRVSLNESQDESLGRITELTNTMRRAGKVATDLSICPDSTNCDRKDYDANDIRAALSSVMSLTAAMHSNHALKCNGKTGFIIGYLDAALHPIQYRDIDSNGNVVSLEATVARMLRETPLDVIKSKGDLCLSGHKDEYVDTCTRMGVRARLTGELR